MNSKWHACFGIGLSAGLLGLGSAGCSSDDSTGSAAATGGGSNPGTIDLVMSGEENATDGILFPEGSEVAIADGWEIKFTHVLVTVDKITLSENPDKSPTDQSQTDALVAELDGPWAVDLHKEGSVVGAGGEGKAVPIASFTGQNKKGHAAFEADTRYAFGYSIVTASASAKKVNFEGDKEAEDAYADMAAKGYAVLYVGEATFKGTTCQTSDDTYAFDAIPKTVPFRIGFATPSQYINCQNQDNQGDAFPDEEYQRGIATKANTAVLAQMTLHIEHPFFSDVEHDPALYFDQMAAQLVGKPAGTELTIDDFKGIDPTSFTDAAKAALPWRVCDGSDLPTTKTRGFAVGSVPVDPSKMPAEALRDYRDFVHYVQSTQGHLNGGEGLCYVKRGYPSPP